METRMTSTDKPCTGCGFPMRKKSVRAADAPGTRSQGARGKCKGCNDKVQRAKKSKILPPLSLHDPADTVFAVRLITRLFPDDLPLLPMLGI